MGRARRGGTTEDRDTGGKLRPNLWVDSFSAALIKQRQDAVVGWGDWLASFRWQVYTVLTLADARERAAFKPRRQSFAKTQVAVDEWLRELRKEYPRLCAYVSYDDGKVNGRLNVHVLISGLFVGQPPKSKLHRNLTTTRAIKFAKRLWTKGLVKKMEPYDDSRGAPSYLAQYCAAGPDLPGEFFGRPIRKSKQRRRWKQC